MPHYRRRGRRLGDRRRRRRPRRSQTLGDDSSQYGELTADVEGAAQLYRGRHQLTPEGARKLLAEAPATERGIDV